MKYFAVIIAFILFYSLRSKGNCKEKDWSHIRYFDKNEFDSADCMSMSLIEKLDELRQVLNKPIQITSSFRTRAKNEELKKQGYTVSSNSSHMKGLAVDIHCPSFDYLKQIVLTARSLGFTRIGQYLSKKGNWFIHLDIDRDKVQTEWAYFKGQKTSLYV